MEAARKDRGDIAEILIDHGASTELVMSVSISLTTLVLLDLMGIRL